MFRVFLMLFALLSSSSVIPSAALETVCSADGNCVEVDADVVIPRTANAEGAAPDLPSDCVDRHPNCARYEGQNQCDENPGWMIVNCPASCKACHLRDRQVRCTKEFLNMSTQDPAFMRPGDVDVMFNRIVDMYGDALSVNVHSRDPW